MILTFSEDLTSTVTLDSVLTAASESGLYANSGVHPLISVDNLLSVLPEVTYTFDTYSAGTTYGKYETTRKRSDIVLSSSIIYQSISASNTGNTPASSPTKWLVTNIESLRLKAFMYSIEDKVKSDLRINKRLITNQYIYNPGDTAVTPAGDYIGWTIEPNGSDYVSTEINQMTCQATTTDVQTVSVVNQGVLIDTFTITPANGILSWQDINYVFQGSGAWHFVIPAREVKIKGATVDPLRLKGLVCYTTTGTGSTAASATYSRHTQDVGLGLNISASLESSQYVTNNLKYYGELYQATLELETMKLMLHNARTRQNTPQKILGSQELLMMEIHDVSAQGNTLNKYLNAKKRALEALGNTFDSQLWDNEMLKITTRRL